MSSFKSKFASLVQDLRNKKSREFSRQPQPAYSEHFTVPPPPPPPIPSKYKSKESSQEGVKTTVQGGKNNERPPSRSGSILRKIGSKASLRELRRKSSFGGRSTTSVNNYGIDNDQPPLPTQDAATASKPSSELTPPPSAGKKSPPLQLSLITHNQPTPPSGAYDDPEDDLYSDPLKEREKAQAAAAAANDIGSSAPAETRQLVAGPASQPEQTYIHNGPPPRPQMYIPGTNSQVLPTIPASPSSTMASPISPTGTNPFRKWGSASPNLAEVADGPFKPVSPILEQRDFESPRLNTQIPNNNDDDSDLQTASPITATKGLMNGLRFSFAPPPVEATPSQITPPTSTHSSPSSPSVRLADNNPFKDLTDEPVGTGKAPIRAIAPPAPSAEPADPSLERTLSGRTPQFKKAPSGKTAVPDNFAPPPPPPMSLPQGWTARWDEVEGKFAYYQGTRSRTEQWDMPTEPAKKLSMRDRRLKKKKEVKQNITNLPSYAEANSPTSESSQSRAPTSLVAPNPSS
ncbi:hypothetical protein TWF225_007179 [Orbilia oligospora]|uniref:Uncharacterized protein n=1 Tax=Orbilia oligospora TaxID=2813651 RepID=A0A7C8K8J5_ORBOL|nr:hypothetical protein TWF751_009948 [Orbilia oligospora]KAF3180818.1 hypothetical protein TWF225_007179 [Orbilia oligospora]KAF3233960.1 hypothetical protein TWF217_004393 [Orbilia oligospora]KAF3236577.1 hypothetical protein TWF128_001312 [Orbilia oligospora]KAF3287224.1 hypothetical protein TWF132_008595 [Orbilia oligospora]